MSHDQPTSTRPGLVARHPTATVMLTLALGLAAGFALRHATAPPPTGAALTATSSAATAEPAEWTCSMHPQIRSDKPGQCPLCGMDLVPVTKTAAPGLRTLSVTPEVRALMQIETVPVERKFVTADVRLVGKVQYDETQLRYVTAWVPGRLDRLYVDFTGVTVNKGEHMVSIYSPDLYSAQEELIQAVRFARGRNDSADLGGVNMVDSAREKLRLLGLTDDQIRQIEGQAQPSDHLTIYAPVGGIVIDKLRQEGDYVRTGERIYTVADLSQVWVELDAYESDLAWIRPGQPVTFTTEAYPGEEFVGRVSFIQPVLDDQTRTVNVRVNVPNPGLKLKPNMFVRGVIHSQVAEGDRAVDASLAGQWVCSMHPWVVKDKPGNCDVCGMALVPAESLGLVAGEGAAARPPLVIPKSAPLVTGRRAVVYVELPGGDSPTFEGREITLGPRAGDYYLVRDGLREGELVVTRGAFKLDSEIQIQARPSMMNPAGGGTAAHQHGGQPPAGRADQPMRAMSMHLVVPADFQRQLATLWQAYVPIEAALASDDFATAGAAVGRLDDALTTIDAAGLNDTAASAWTAHHREIVAAVAAMQSAQDIDAARTAFRPLSDQFIVLAESFGFGDDATVYRLHCPMAFAGEGAYWLQPGPEPRNPYYGAMMLTCNDLVEQIAGAEDKSKPTK